MSPSATNQVREKIFIGFELSIDIKIQLNQNSQWKQDEIENAKSEEHLKIIRFRDEEYIGKYLAENLVTLESIQAQAASIKMELETYIPQFNADALKVALFPQVFIS